MLENFKKIRSNITAGIIVGIVSIPLSMAFAIASGVRPEQGLYTSIIAGIIVGLFGGTKTQISGPTGAFVVILVTVVSQHGIDGLQIATILAGIILLVMGVLKIGNIVKFIPFPVIVGFTSGIGLIIFIGQLKNFFGLPITIPIDDLFYAKLALLVKSLPALDMITLALSILSLFIIIFSPKYIKSIPSPLIAILFATFFQCIFKFKNISTIGSVFGEIPGNLPKFQIPNFDNIPILSLLGPSFTIALLGAIESLLSAAAADSITGTKHNPNKELIGQGLANFIAPFFGGFSSTGAIARTATSIRNGGSSPIAAIVHSIVLILTIIVFSKYVSLIPLSSLAAILVVVAFNMSDIPAFLKIAKKAPWYDILAMIITFFITIFVDLVVAVATGVVISIITFIIRMHQTVGLQSIKHKAIIRQIIGEKINEKKSTEKSLRMSEIISIESNNVIIYDINGPFFFGAAERFERSLSATSTDPLFVIFKMKNVPFIDITGLEIFLKLIEQYSKRGVKIFICEANKRVSKKLSKIGIFSIIESNKSFDSIEDIQFSSI